MKFSKTIFQAWKILENNLGHTKSKKISVEKEGAPCVQPKLLRVR